MYRRLTRGLSDADPEHDAVAPRAGYERVRSGRALELRAVAERPLLRASGRRRTAGSASHRSSSAPLGSARAASPSCCRRTPWQAYNFRDIDGDGWGDTWYAGGVAAGVLDRPFLQRGVPPRFKQHDRGVPALARGDAARGRRPRRRRPRARSTRRPARALYDLVVFPGHSEYVTEHTYDVVERYRDLGGNLLFLSANNFFWKVEKRARQLRRIALWRSLGRPSAAARRAVPANDDGSPGMPFVVRRGGVPWLWDGTDLADGATFGEFVGGFGIEIDARSATRRPGRRSWPRSRTSSAPATRRR